MDRNYILNCTKKFYLEHKIDDTFVELLNDFCIKKEHPEHLHGLIQIINMPMLNSQIIDKILIEYGKEFKIIKLVNLNTNQIINIY